MKVLLWIISAINIYAGIYFLLNAIAVLQSGKYSQAATIVFAILFLCMGAGSLYIFLVKHQVKLALLIGIGPWILALLFLLFNMMTADYK